MEEVQRVFEGFTNYFRHISESFARGGSGGESESFCRGPEKFRHISEGFSRGRMEEGSNTFPWVMKYFKQILESFCEMEMEKSPKAFGELLKPSYIGGLFHGS